MKSYLLQCVLLAPLLSGPAWGAPADQKNEYAAAAKPAGAWKWSLVHQGDDILLDCTLNEKTGYSFTIGAGGGISAMEERGTKPRSLLAPTFKGEHTDRIIQWTAWCDDIVSNIRTAAPSSGRFNITQGGDVEGSFARIIEVVPDQKSRRLDVFAVPQEQWKIEQQKEIHCKLSCLTRYELQPRGVLKISRFIEVGKVTLNGKEVRFSRLYLEGWTPFLRSVDTFDAVTTAVDGRGAASKVLAAGDAFPYYPEIDATTTDGYAIAFDRLHPAKTAIGVVFGNKPPMPAAAGNESLLNLMQWDNGIAILPGAIFRNVERGSIVEQTIYLVARPALSKELRQTLLSVAQEAVGPVLHAPETLAAGDLRQIHARLTEYADKPGEKTEHLYPLVADKKMLSGD